MTGSRKNLLLAAFMSVLLFHVCSKTEASAFDCCLQYTEQVIPSRLIKGFEQQLANDACDINAIILYTKRGLAVCADPKKKWVKHVVHVLSKKVRKM
ncbi:C-C motif chemokine 20 isoform X2 [Pipistrellus kuhlii]|uniref:C-C motif chemokine n=1 Tax=Pipistrellus kuhlii TaxID=59472 RepID=A0A7J7XUK2_PIPKU|nr:C-C motif chemokine 20 isoform X2 [Pipistrellus kuhlii]KAF6353010.1 C-C motif chemokine ligand 20 [Pipistrellus kuhlii]